jgi:hypothetical protein
MPKHDVSTRALASLEAEMEAEVGYSPPTPTAKTKSVNPTLVTSLGVEGTSASDIYCTAENIINAVKIDIRSRPILPPNPGIRERRANPIIPTINPRGMRVVVELVIEENSWEGIISLIRILPMPQPNNTKDSERRPIPG